MRCRIWSLLLTVAAGAASPAWPQNIDDRKTGAELFASNCAACHRSPSGMAVAASSAALKAFLRQHYTVDARSASELTSYLSSAGSKPAAGSRKLGERANSTEIGSIDPRSVRAGKGSRTSRRTMPKAEQPSPAAAAVDQQTDRKPIVGSVRPEKPDRQRSRRPVRSPEDGCPLPYSCFPLYGAYGP
jgi:hypothetical protein